MAAQILMTKNTMVNNLNRRNARNTFEELLELGAIPVVNENDSISSYELEMLESFGDNDTLSAVIAGLIGADLLILPNLTDVHKKERTKDELPQSASGTTIMTTEPKFVPKEAVSVKLGEDVEVKIRLVDCVGYMVEGASGHIENGTERQGEDTVV
mgnify:CR=1 FL=1